VHSLPALGAPHIGGRDGMGLAVWDRKEGITVPKGKHMRGVSSKEQRQYEHIKESAQKSGRYGRRATEVAARTVMKQHKQKGHSKGH
jgi:hypothetical protein